MQFRRSPIDVAPTSGERFSGDAALLERVAQRPGRPSALGTRSARRARSRTAWLALTVCMALLPAVGQAQVVEWARSAGGYSHDTAGGIALDDTGNSYVTGSFSGTATFGPFTLTSVGTLDIFVAKYNTCGNGSVDPGEECNDGGESATCDPDCTVARRGVRVGTRNHVKKEEQVR